MALRRIAIALWLAGCAPGGETGGTIDVTATLDRAAADFGVVRVTGLPFAGDTTALSVFAATDSVLAGSPTLSGRWSRSGDTMLFTPRFPPSSGVALWVRADGARLGRTDSARLLQWWQFDFPAVAGDTSPPTLVAIHPAGDSLPENLLRWYLEFSRPMRPGQALDHVRLVDDQGGEDRTAFLDTSEELWDPEGRRLTLLFDPGRVKRGIRTNVEQGRPLVAGHAYRLRIEPGWEDLSGRGLEGRSEKMIVTTAADHDGPDPLTWDLLLPVVGGTDPLVVSFGEPLDHALATQLIAVIDERGAPVRGAVVLKRDDREWRFTPDEPWTEGRYQLLTSPELEDVAGNRPGRPFDHETGTVPGGASPTGPIVRRFEPRRRTPH